MDRFLYFVTCYKYIKSIEDALLYYSNLDREEAYKRLYEIVFQGGLNHTMQECFPFDWLDPDMGYDDDYITWRQGADEAFEKVMAILKPWLQS